VKFQHKGDCLIATAPAKVNLHLEVLGKRPDGYHELETLMVSLDLADEITFQDYPSGTDFRCSHREAGEGDDNLVVKAVNLIRRETGVEKGISIALTKRIPIAAGLAGGSSDAATALAGLDRWWNLNLGLRRLTELGAMLGSDVPFFFHAPAAVCRGRGEIVTPCRMGTQLNLVLVRPPRGLSTAMVFRSVNCSDSRRRVEPMVEALEQGDLRTIGDNLFNRLEESSFAIDPDVAALKRHMEGLSPWGTLMSGSGSTVYSLTANQAESIAMGHALEAAQLGTVFVASTSD
jgi:4-diphosphocytidyl-2-C-methyl-D-erythritol kinase